MIRVAVIQMCSGSAVGPNLARAGELIAEGTRQGAALVVLPENFSLMPLSERDRLQAAEPAGDGPVQSFLSETARAEGVWIIAGTTPIRSAHSDAHVRAACLVYDSLGRLAARYDKMHLFDVTVASGESYQESRYVEPGDDLTTVDTPAGCVGLTVCYDVRFPELYRTLVDRGATILSVPSAFTETTGRAHWDVLLRARAIENLAYVIAPAQSGTHANGRRTFGHSLIIDPWGERLACVDGGEGVATADVDPERQHEIRERFPSISHRRLRLPDSGAIDNNEISAKWTLRERLRRAPV